MKEDFAVGALDATIVSLGFACSLGWHPIVPIVSFVDGVLGRHQSRLRKAIAEKGDNVASNSAALLTHSAIGTLKMGAILNPIAGFGLGLSSIMAVSFSHSLSKGSFRVVFDKTFGNGGERRRVLGVAYGSLLNFGQSVLIGLVYKGSGLATAMQVAFAAGGATLLFSPIVKRKVRRLRALQARPAMVLRHVSLQSAARPHAAETFVLAEPPVVA